MIFVIHCCHNFIGLRKLLEMVMFRHMFSDLSQEQMSHIREIGTTGKLTVAQRKKL